MTGRKPFFYLDPPYFGSEGDYEKELFNRDQFAATADRLSTLKGRFILSINNAEPIRMLFARFAIEEVELTYSISGPPTLTKELIISSAI